MVSYQPSNNSDASAEPAGADPHRPSDHVDSAAPAERAGEASGAVTQPKLGVIGWLRFAWRQLTSMRTAILLLLLLAIAAVPGSLVPQRSSDPNGVSQYFASNPDTAPIMDKFQLFDVYSSAWFSAVYLLLFISLIGCIVPRTKHHLAAMRARPPKTPARLERLPAYTERMLSDGASIDDELDRAAAYLRRQGYRVDRLGPDAATGSAGSVAAERGYLRETGNLVFHVALVGILAAVAVGGGFGFTGQRVVVTGQSFVNTLAAYDSFNPGRFFSPDTLTPYAVTLRDFDVTYETKNQSALGQPIDFTAHVDVTDQTKVAQPGQIKVNQPLRTHDTDLYLLGNGYAPTITVRDPAGKVVFTDSVPFLPQTANLTSVGVVKVPDGLAKQLGMVGFFYPTQTVLASGAFTSDYPDLVYPVLTLNVYEGDLGINAGAPKSVYALDTTGMTQLTGGKTGVKSLELKPGETAQLPGGRGSVTFENESPSGTNANDLSHSVKRFASLEIHRDPSQGWVLAFAILIMVGLALSLFVPRRRIWVKALAVSQLADAPVLQFAGLARGDDPRLDAAVGAVATKLVGEVHDLPERTLET
ncbi:MAG TPA: cytochrome c biogenesis protein ResB [Candidatus Lumbricidophila sp.]|nr:cytochrome c biogenesis protein ResB [Candidatus Lumbricidophila sp.]